MFAYTKEAAAALCEVQQDLLPQNYSLKVYDCYRPQMAVDQFVLWASNPDILMKNEFYPNLTKDVLFPDRYVKYVVVGCILTMLFSYIASNSSHSRGSTIDLTVVAL